MYGRIARTTVGVAAVFTALLAWGGYGAAAEAPARAAEFQKAVAPFLERHCLTCHGPDRQDGKLRLDALDGDLVKGRDAQVWNDVRAKLLAGAMPPPKRPRPPVADLQRVVDFLTDGLTANGKVALRQPPDFNHPRFGNRADHADLFAPRPGGVASSPARVWRLSSFGYTGLTSGLIDTRDAGKKGGGDAIIQPFGSGGHGFNDFSALLQIDEPTITQLLNNAATIVEFQTTAGTRKGPPTSAPKPSKELIALVTGTEPPSRAEMEAGIRLQFKYVLQREPTADEVKEFTALMAKNVKAAGRTVGVRTALMAVLLLPEALYRIELGDGKPDAHGRSRLAPREVAFALSYAFTDQRPDAALRAAAESGRLDTADGVRKEVARLLDDPQYQKPRVLRFFQEYFGYHTAQDVFKNKSDFKDHAPYVLVRDTDRLVEYVLARDKNVLVELLTTRKSFVGYDQKPKGTRLNYQESLVISGDAYLSYNLDARPDPAVQPIDMPAGQRMGILTQPSWLVAHSENTDNHPILRGKWVRERLLGGTIPDLPITVNAMLPDAPEKTLRARLEVTREAYCWRCHQQMNPLGVPFEVYDHFGRFRTTESVVDPTKPKVKGQGKNAEAVPARRDVPLEASGAIADSGDPKLDGDVPDALKMIEKLAASDRVRQVFVRHAFRYWMGRNETLSDGPTLVAADKAYVASGGSMKALITALLTSDSFLYRKP